MSVYQINYDLRNKRDYQALYEKIDDLGVNCKILESCYLLVSNQSAKQVHDEIITCLDHDDGLIVAQINTRYAHTGLNREANQWIHNNLNR